MGKHSDQTRSGHNIRFTSKWWKNSWLLIVVFLVTYLISVKFIYDRYPTSVEEKTQTVLQKDSWGNPIAVSNYDELTTEAKIQLIPKLTEEFQNTGSPDILINLINAHISNEDYEQALLLQIRLDELINEQDKDFGYYEAAGRLAMQVGDYDKALEYLNRAIEVGNASVAELKIRDEGGIEIFEFEINEIQIIVDQINGSN